MLKPTFFNTLRVKNKKNSLTRFALHLFFLSVIYNVDPSLYYIMVDSTRTSLRNFILDRSRTHRIMKSPRSILLQDTLQSGNVNIVRDRI